MSFDCASAGNAYSGFQLHAPSDLCNVYSLLLFDTVTGFPLVLSIPMMSVVCMAYTALVSASQFTYNYSFDFITTYTTFCCLIVLWIIHYSAEILSLVTFHFKFSIRYTCSL